MPPFCAGYMRPGRITVAHHVKMADCALLIRPTGVIFIGRSTKFWYKSAMQPKNTSFSVGKHFAGFIEEQVEQGRYASASDVVRAGLRLLEQQEAQLAALRAAIAAGDESGDS